MMNRYILGLSVKKGKKGNQEVKCKLAQAKLLESSKYSFQVSLTLHRKMQDSLNRPANLHQTEIVALEEIWASTVSETYI